MMPTTQTREDLMNQDDDQKLGDEQRREFLKKLGALTAGAVATTYVTPKIAMATSTAGVSPGGMVPMVVIQSLFNFMQTQGSPDKVVLYCVEQEKMSNATAVFTYDQMRAAHDVTTLNMFVNGIGPMPGVSPADKPKLDEARAALRHAAVKAAPKSKWPWE
jgi:hypothetical protein